MKSSLPKIIGSAAILCLALAVSPPAQAGPLKALGAGLSKLNPFKKAQAKPVEPPPPAANPKTTAAKPTKPAPAKKKKAPVSTNKKSGAGATAAAATAAAAPAGNDPKNTAEGADAPSIPETPAAAEGTTPPTVDATPAAPAEIPFGTPVMGRKGLVRSPFAEDQGMVDVTDLPAGAKVKCPFTGKVFRVP